jgi:hypothetical protein
MAPDCAASAIEESHRTMVRDTSNWAASSKTGQKAAATASLNALSAAKALLGPLDYVTWVDKFGVFIATEGDFREHAKVADGASDVLTSIFGADKLSSRVVLGVASLPLRVPIQIGTSSRSRTLRFSSTSSISFPEKDD